DSVPWIVGYEADRSFSQYPQPNAVSGTYTLLSNSPIGTSDHANSSVYQASSGAWVFAAGTIQWSYALDNFLGYNLVDPRIQQATANILDRFVANPQSDFTIAASPASQTVPQGGSTSYSVTIGPTGGFTGHVTLSVSGLPSGANASFTPNPATATSTLSVTTSSSTPIGAYTLTTTGACATLFRSILVRFVANPQSDFTIGASPASQTVPQGGSTSYGVTISPTG